MLLEPDVGHGIIGSPQGSMEAMLVNLNVLNN